METTRIPTAAEIEAAVHAATKAKEPAPLEPATEGKSVFNRLIADEGYLWFPVRPNSR
jgi:hypothetical protein